MAIKRPDEYEHTNSELSVVDSLNVRGGVKVVADQAAMLALPPDKLKEGSTVKYKDGASFLEWELQDISDITDINNWLNLNSLFEVKIQGLLVQTSGKTNLTILENDDLFRYQTANRYVVGVILDASNITLPADLDDTNKIKLQYDA
ncbi:MAG: hypothetical protein ACJAVA_000372 [Flavobacteriaceae bacterium]|jgi:hypothetical protein